jgi:hypothetical protein
MKHLLPPRPAGAGAMMRGTATADVVLVWHIGFEGLDTFGGILRAISSKMAPIRFVMRRVSRSQIPSNNIESFTEWLDNEWMRMDQEVEVALNERNHHG